MLRLQTTGLDEPITLRQLFLPAGRGGFSLIGPIAVSIHGLDLEELDRIGVAAVRRAMERGHVVVADEIGRSELLMVSVE